MAEKKEIGTGFTAKAIVIGLIVGVYIAFFYATGEGIWLGCWENYYYYKALNSALNYQMWGQPFLRGLGYAVIVLMIVSIVNKLKPRLFSIKECIVMVFIIITMSAVTLGDAWNIGLNYQLGMFPYPGVWTEEQVVQRINQIPPPLRFGVDQPGGIEYYELSNPGWFASEVNWGFYIPGSIFVALFFGAFLSIGLCIVLLFRRLYLEVEALPFPLTSIVTDTIEVLGSTTPTQKRRGWLNNWVFIGFFIQLAWGLIDSWGHWIPQYIAHNNRGAVFDFGFFSGWLEGRVGTASGTPMNLVFDAASVFGIITPYIPLIIWLEPYVIGWGGYLEIDTLVGFVISWLAIWVIAPSIMVSSGTWPMPEAPVDPFTSIDRIYWGSQLSGGGINAWVITLGLVLGLAIWPIWRRRKLMVKIFLGLFKEPESDVDPKRPVSYRVVWIGLILSIILFLAMGYMLWIPIIPLLISILLLIPILIGCLRLVTETGGMFGLAAVGLHVQWMASILMTPFWFVSGYLLFDVVQQLPLDQGLFNYYWLAGYRPLMTILVVMTMFMSIMAIGTAQIQRLRSNNDKSGKKIITLGLSVAVIAIFVGMLSCSFSMAALPQGMWWGGWNNYVRKSYIDMGRSMINSGSPPVLNQFASYVVGPGATDFLIKVAVGIALTGLIPFLRTRLTWLRVGVAGLALGTFMGYYTGPAFLAALIIKFITYRAYGAEIFEKKVKPLFLGFIIAGLLVQFINPGYLWTINKWDLLGIPYPW